MINLDLTTGEAQALADSVGVFESVEGHISDDLAAADAKLIAALAGTRPEPPADRYPEPAPGAATWDEAFPPLTGETAAAILDEILFDAGFARLAIETADDRLAVTIADVLEAFRGNCWDDQHDGGAHRQDLIDVNRLVRYLGDPDGDDLAEVLDLPGDDTQEGDPTR
jgi:hypothetical protein